MSYAKLSARKVSTACRELLADREKTIVEKREQRIKELMQPRWFFKSRTREQAIDYMKSSPSDFILSEWEEIDYCGELHYSRVKHLLLLSEVTPRGEDNIFVTAEDAFIIKDYLK